MWWLIAHTPNGGKSWEIGEQTPAALDDLVLRAKVVLSVPAGDPWISQPSLGFDVQLAPGRPHRSLLAVCPQADVAELAAVTAQAVDARRAADVQARNAALVADVEAALRLIPDADVDAVYARRRPPTGEASTGTGRKV